MNSVHIDRARVVDLTNEELGKCRRRIGALEDERDATFNAIEAAEGGGGGGAVANRALADRLHRKHAKICREIEAELILEEKVRKVNLNWLLCCCVYTEINPQKMSLYNVTVRTILTQISISSSLS